MTNPNQINAHTEFHKQEMPTPGYVDNESIPDTIDRKVERKQSSQMDDLEDYETFINTHSDELAKLNSKQEIADYLYTYYCENKQQNEIRVSDIYYTGESSEAHYNAAKKLAEFGVKSLDSNSWNVLQSGEIDHDKLGRLYINLKNENLISSFYQIATKLAKNGTQFQMKFPKKMDSGDHDRSDKTVLYFNNESADEVMRILTDYVEENPDKMNTNTPRFTKKLTNAEGEILPGIAFAENPAGRRGSFNDQIAEVLADTYMSSNKNGKIDINDENFYLNFSKFCDERGIDISHMYKNKNSNFPNI